MTHNPDKAQFHQLIDNYKRRVKALKEQLAATSIGISEQIVQADIQQTEENLRLRQRSGMLSKEVEKIYSRRLQLLRMMLAKELPYASVNVLLEIEEAEEGMEQLQKQLTHA